MCGKTSEAVERKGVLRLEFLLLCTYSDHFISLGCGGMFLILPIVYFVFWEITPDIHDRALKSMK